MPWYSSAIALLEYAGGQPRELYTFARDNQVWRYALASRDVTVPAWSLTYTAALIERETIERASESRGNAIVIRIARTTPVADAIREIRTRPMSLRIDRWQAAASGASVPYTMVFGDLANPRLRDGWLELDLITSEQKFSLPFPSRIISRQNQYPTFSPFTAVVEADFSFETTITAMTRSKITVAAKAPGTSDGYYDGGQIMVGGIPAVGTSPTGERMYVRYSQGLDFYINGRAVTGLSVGDTITLIAGDDKTLVTAHDKFGQKAVEHFLGFDLLPTTDPLQTGLMTVSARSPYSTPLPTPPDDGGVVPLSNIVITPFPAETMTGGSVRLTISDPESRLISIEQRTNQVGVLSTWGSYATVTPETDGSYVLSGTKGAAGYVAIEARITYTSPTTGLPTAVTPAWDFASGYVEAQELIEGLPICEFSVGIGAVCWDLFHKDMTRGVLEMTGNRKIQPLNTSNGRTNRLVLEASAGPFTLTFPQDDGVGFPCPSRLDGAPVTSITVSGQPAFELVRTSLHSYEWTSL